MYTYFIIAMDHYQQLKRNIRTIEEALAENPIPVQAKRLEADLFAHREKLRRLEEMTMDASFMKPIQKTEGSA